MDIQDLLAEIFHPHDGRFVIFACALAVLASYTALEIAGRIQASAGLTRYRWLAISALALGGGIWAMHFVAMLGMKLAFAISFDHRLTFLSFTIATAASAAGLFLAFWLGPSRAVLAAGGAIMGSGVAAMHYLGMAAMRMPMEDPYDMRLVALSIVIAIAASTVALRLATTSRGLKRQVLSAVVMGFAIVAMHFTGMAAFMPDMDHTMEVMPIADQRLGNAVIYISVLLLLAGLRLVYQDKVKHRFDLLTLSQLGISAIIADDIEVVFHRAVATARDILGVNAALILDADAGRITVLAADTAADVPRPPAEAALDKPFKQVLQDGKPFAFGDTADHPPPSSVRAFLGWDGLEAGLILPMPMMEGRQSLICVFAGNPRRFSEEDLSFLRRLMEMIDILRTRNAARKDALRKLRQQMALTEFSSVALRSDNLPALYRMAAEVMRTAMDMDHAAILEIDEQADNVILHTHSGWAFDLPADYSLKRQAPTAFMPMVLAAPGVFTFQDMDKRQCFDRNDALEKYGVKSGVGFAVRAVNERALVLVAFSQRSRRDFQDTEEFVRTLGNMLVSLYDRYSAAHTLRLRDQALNSISQGITITDETTAEKAVIYTNPAFSRMTEYPVDDVTGLPWERFLASDAPAGLPEALALARAKKRVASFETRLRRRDGTRFTDRVTLSPIVDADGDLTHYVAVHEDVTEERRRDEQLHEAQKMEAVGQLTGGIAHDFNNLLTVVKANAEDMREELKGNALLHRQCNLVLQAADRGGDLVRQLMAFARKQELEPRVVNLNTMLDAFAKLVRRTLQENITIDVRKTPGLPDVKVDPGRLENAVLNLILNARDAMPDGGQIVIETDIATLDSYYARENPGVAAGKYILLSVSDNGSGMTREVREKAFQPFFTTKEVGQGTGLGLSMVYGFVRQTGGHAKIYSEVDRGTTIKIYLPPTDDAAAVLAPEAEAVAAGAATGSILVVEDDDLVRESVCTKLTRFGYTITSVDSAALAIAALEKNPRIDLVFTDVIMPGSMTGADLAREVQRRWPAARLLMTSGYTEASALGKVKLPEGIRLLSKPYSNVDLADAIRAAMTIP